MIKIVFFTLVAVAVIATTFSSPVPEADPEPCFGLIAAILAAASSPGEFQN